MPTILDVAAKAGVGVGTVSRVLNNSPHVAEPTRAKVEAAIAELGYRPSAVARALSSGKTAALPVLSASITSPSASIRLRGILDVVDEVHEVVVCDVRDPAQRVDFVDRHAVRLPAFGALTISLDLDEREVRAFADSGVPVISIDHRTEGVPSIVIDDVAAGTKATQHLLDLGHTRIGFLGDPELGDYRSRASEERRHGYRAALKGADLPWDEELEVTVEGGKRPSAARLLSVAERPTAVVADADATALCVLAAAREAGLSVPGDVSLVGFDDLWAAGAVGLTTVAQPLEESGRKGAQMLFTAARGEEVPPLTTLETKLVVRETTAPPS